MFFGCLKRKLDDYVSSSVIWQLQIYLSWIWWVLEAPREFKEWRLLLVILARVIGLRKSEEIMGVHTHKTSYAIVVYLMRRNHNWTRKTIYFVVHGWDLNIVVTPYFTQGAKGKVWSLFLLGSVALYLRTIVLNTSESFSFALL